MPPTCLFLLGFKVKGSLLLLRFNQEHWSMIFHSSVSTLFKVFRYEQLGCVYMCAETHKKRANATRLAPSSNPCRSQTFLPLSGLWFEGASLPKRSEASRGPISAKPMLQRWSHSVNSATPCPLIHHITLLRALLRTEGKEAKGEG